MPNFETSNKFSILENYNNFQYEKKIVKHNENTSTWSNIAKSLPIYIPNNNTQSTPKYVFKSKNKINKIEEEDYEEEDKNWHKEYDNTISDDYLDDDAYDNDNDNYNVYKQDNEFFDYSDDNYN